MARKRKKTQAATRRRQPRARRRVSTRRITTTRVTIARARAARPRAARRRAAPVSARAAETLRVTFELTDVAGRPIVDPATFFTFRRLDTDRQVDDQRLLELGGAPASFDVPVATNRVYYCEIDPQRFRFATSPPFFATPGPPLTRAVPLMREPDEWAPRFTPWAALPPAFDRLKEVLHLSPRITLVKDSDPIAGLLVEDAYDAVSVQSHTLAKTALLNIYYRLNGTLEPIAGNRSWFSFVKRLLAIDRERFVAVVDPEMEALVSTIHTHIEQFSADYERSPAEIHRGNVPIEMQPRISRMISLKSSHDKGNFQLTVVHLTGPDEVLLDADIDENGDLLGHFLDLFKHSVSGGTHPHDIHEILVLQDGSKPGFDLGYHLE